MLEIKNIFVKVKNKEIINNLSLKIKSGEIHLLMGPNGSGKSSLAKSIMGNKDYLINEGYIKFLGENLKKLSIEERVHKGIFLSFQNPVEIEGVSNINFLRTISNLVRNYRKEKILNPSDFLKFIKQKLKELNIYEDFLYRSLNVNFSGGEKKKNEILQMIVLKPYLMILDEIDSGLDIDSIKIISKMINNLKKKMKSFLLITHYPSILKFINPDYVHIITKGRIIYSGNADILPVIEKKGYKWVDKEYG